MKFDRQLWIAGMALALTGLPGTANAEIVDRELGTDSEGNTVKGHVFQAGRGFGRSTSRRSSLPVRRSRWASRGIDRGYRYPYSYYYVPFASFHYGSPISFCRVPARYFGGSSFSVRVVR
jgi:hypothetical protein